MNVLAEKYDKQGLEQARAMNSIGRRYYITGEIFLARSFLSRADVLFEQSNAPEEELDNLMELFRAETVFGRDQLHRRLAKLIRDTGHTERRKEFLLMAYGLDHVIRWFKKLHR